MQANKNISLIVPVYNGKDFIDDFLKSAHKILSNNEVIFVDNGSDDGSLEYLKKTTKKYNFCKVLRFTKKQSSYAARNFGVAKASGKLLAFTDIDCILTNSYVNYLEQKKNLIKDYLLTGPVNIFFKSENIYEIFDKNTYLLQEEYAKNQYAATANLITTREIFEKVGGFPEFTSGADNKFCKKAEKLGFRIIFKKDLIIEHPPRDSFKEHIVKAKRLGIGHGERFLDLKKGIMQLFFILSKQVISIFLPLNSARIFLRIKSNHDLNFTDTCKIIYLCLAVNIYQRIEIIKTILRR